MQLTVLAPHTVPTATVYHIDEHSLKPGTIRLAMRTACRRCGWSFLDVSVAERTQHILACEPALKEHSDATDRL